MVELDNVPVIVIENARSGFNSTKDLKDASLHFEISDSPGSINGPSLSFKFPPDFSRINNLVLTKETMQSGNAPGMQSYMKYFFNAPVILNVQ